MDNYKRSFVLFAFLALLFVGISTTSANAATLYVATNGNDANPGTQNSPVASVKQAFILASSGDTIYLRNGRYTLSRFLYVDKPNLTFSSAPGESATIFGSNSDASNMGFVIGIFANNITLQNLTIEGGETYVVKVEVAANTVIRNCRIFNSGRDCIKTFNSDNLLIEKCNIGPSGVRDNSNAEGIDSIGSIGVTIRDNYIHDTATVGLYLKGGARNGVVERNRIERAGHAGLLLGQDTDLDAMRDGTPYECLDTVARNNVIINTQGAGFGTYSGSNIRFENNTAVNVAQSFHGGVYIVMNSREVPSRQVKVRNNVVVVNSTRPFYFVINLADQLVCDSNIYHKQNGGAYKFFRETPNSGDYWESFSAWRSGMGVDGRSRTVDPMVDTANACAPMSGSPTIDGGEAVNNSTDYMGAARPQGATYDVGAHERGGSSTQPPAQNQPPTVTASATPTTGTAPLVVAFTANASDPEGQQLTYSWEFGNGATSAQANPTYTYQVASAYTARVTVRDPQGATATATVTIAANSPANRPPTVSVSPSATSGPAPLSVTFTTTASDPDGQIASYSWDFGDGTTSTQRSPAHVYQKDGTYVARVTVRDNGGATAGTQVTITVESSKIEEVYVKLLTPVGGEVLNGGSTYMIKWNATGTGLRRIDIAYTLDNGGTWTDIINGPAGYSELAWRVPNVKAKACRIRIVIYGAAVGTGQDISPGKFKIVKNKALTKQ